MQLFLVLLASLVLTTLVKAEDLAQPLSAADKFEQGMTFFKNKQYLSAREAFMQARMNSADNSLIYNLGVVNYKLGFYPSAETHFLELTNDAKYQSLAFYNLALIAFKMEKDTDAIHWLEKCVTTSQSDSLTQLAKGLLNKSDYPTQQIASIDASVIKKSDGKQNSKSIKTFIKSLAGHDDNVTQYLAYSKRKFADVFYDMQFDSAYSPYQSITLESTIFMHWYTNASNYNTSEFSIAANYANRFSQWHYLIRNELSKQLIDNKEFQQLIDNRIDLSYPLTPQLRTISSYNLQVVRIDNRIYNHLAGYVNQWKQQLEYRYNNWRYTLAYSYEQNQRHDFYIKDNVLASSFSPRTHAGEADIVYIGQKTNLELYGKSGISNYPDKNILHPNSTNQRSVYQQSLLINYGMRFSWRFYKDFYAIARFYHERNYSNLSLYRYEKNVYQTGISWQF